MGYSKDGVLRKIICQMELKRIEKSTYGVDCVDCNDQKEGKWYYYSSEQKVIREASSFVEALGKVRNERRNVLYVKHHLYL